MNSICPPESSHDALYRLITEVMEERMRSRDALVQLKSMVDSIDQLHAAAWPAITQAITPAKPDGRF